MRAGFSAVADFFRVLAILPHVELGRRKIGIRPLVSDLRIRGLRGRVRGIAERRDLQRVIGRLDAMMPGGGNCYRRTLLEIALDPAAAAAQLHLGLAAHGGSGSGHAWLGDASADANRYDVRIDV
jgi:hypothetical protein